MSISNEAAYISGNETHLETNAILSSTNNFQPSFSIAFNDPSIAQATITIPQLFVDHLYQEAALLQRDHIRAQGFSKGQIPIVYIMENFKSNLSEHVKEFLLKYCVLDFLHQQIHAHKLLVVGDPRLAHIYVEPGQDASFCIELSIFTNMPSQDWKYLPFKSPKRKNYKDLDRQVDGFIEEEKELLKSSLLTTISLNDWVCLDIQLLDSEKKPVFGEYKANIWLKIGEEEADSTFNELFLGKHLGDTFITANKNLQDYFSYLIDMSYSFQITIADLLKSNHFCLDQFKHYFKLKTNKELYQRLIEVFSYRNDISLRRSIAEEALKTLLAKHRFTIPNYLILRQQKNVLDKIKHNPDYHVYRVQKDFEDRVRQLAEKQIRESVFLDQLAYNENLNTTNTDIKGYLNLTNRPRMKDFLYFDMPSTKISGQEAPLAHYELKRFCLREKALNHIIYHLTKK
jgi:FKBP-type peptidyl-prolyl cis-trans isomerase (trigger factor)